MQPPDLPQRILRILNRDHGGHIEVAADGNALVERQRIGLEVAQELVQDRGDVVVADRQAQ